MARIARIIAPGLPHHVTQRGNRRQQTFFCDDDYREYLSLMSEWTGKYGVEIWAWCLMPNHVHLIAVPAAYDYLAKAIGGAHRRYTRMINFREKWRGHLWQERFASFPLKVGYFFIAVVAALFCWPFTTDRLMGEPRSSANPAVKFLVDTLVVNSDNYYLSLTNYAEFSLVPCFFC